MLQVLIMIPDTEKFYKNVEKASTLSSEAEEAIRTALAEHTDDIAFNTYMTGNKKLINLVVNHPTATLASVNSFISTYGLQWDVQAAIDLNEETGEITHIMGYKDAIVKSFLIDDSLPYRFGKFQGQPDFIDENDI